MPGCQISCPITQQLRKWDDLLQYYIPHAEGKLLVKAIFDRRYYIEYRIEDFHFETRDDEENDDDTTAHAHYFITFDR